MRRREKSKRRVSSNSYFLIRLAKWTKLLHSMHVAYSKLTQPPLVETQGNHVAPKVDGTHVEARGERDTAHAAPHAHKHVHPAASPSRSSAPIASESRSARLESIALNPFHASFSFATRRSFR